MRKTRIALIVSLALNGLLIAGIGITNSRAVRAEFKASQFQLMLRDCAADRTAAREAVQKGQIELASCNISLAEARSGAALAATQLENSPDVATLALVIKTLKMLL